MLRWPFLFVGNSHEFQLMGLGDHIAAVVGRLRVNCQGRLHSGKSSY